jgi:hypothetical protein
VLVPRHGKGLRPEAIRDRRGAENIYLAYATEQGEVALDNNLFAEVLAAEIRKRPGDMHPIFWWHVRSGVAARSNKTQIPWSDDSCVGRLFYFQPPDVGTLPPAAPIPAPSLPRARTWTKIVSKEAGRLYFSRQAAIYSEPSRTSAPLGLIPAGTEFQTDIELGNVGSREQWYKFTDNFGQTAYVPFHDSLMLR